MAYNVKVGDLRKLCPAVALIFLGEPSAKIELYKFRIVTDAGRRRIKAAMKLKNTRLPYYVNFCLFLFVCVFLPHPVLFLVLHIYQDIYAHLASAHAKETSKTTSRLVVRL